MPRAFSFTFSPASPQHKSLPIKQRGLCGGERVTVNNNSPIQDYVHPEDQTQPGAYGSWLNQGSWLNLHLIIHLTDRSLSIAGEGGGGGGCAGDFRGGSLHFWEIQNGGISRNWEPKRGDCWKLWKDNQRGDHSNLLGKWRHVKGITKAIKCY